MDEQLKEKNENVMSQYQWKLANLIAERDKIWTQISLIENEEERRHQFSMFEAYSLCRQQIREISAVCAQGGKWYYPKTTYSL